MYQQKVNCPDCGQRVKVAPKNPTACESCKSEFNVVTRSIPIRLDLRPEIADKAIETFHKIGQWFLERFQERILEVRIFPREKGSCSSGPKDCVKKKPKKKPTEEFLTIERQGKKYCSACGKEFLMGKTVRGQLIALAKEKFSDVPRAALFDSAFERAKSLFNRWLSDNWKRWAVIDKIESCFKECKTKGSEAVAGEPSEITYIRELWRQIRTPTSLLAFFDIYWNARKISKSKRKARRERLKQLSLGISPEVLKKAGKRAKKARNKLPDVAEILIKPVCEGCEYLERYEWGWECKLEEDRKDLRITKFPDFPSTLVDLKAGGYKIKKEFVELGLWEKKKRERADIHDREWLFRQGYDFEHLDNSRSVFLLKRPSRPWKSSERNRQPQYYLMYPDRQVVKIKPGDWLHIVAYGPTTTCILSLNGPQEKVKFFQHGEIVETKEYYQAQRRKARKGYFERPRLKEARKVRLMLHEETSPGQMVQYLSGFPGRVVLLNIQKKQYSRGVSERKELNQRLSQWTDSIFRPLLRYKAELKGFRTEEVKFDLTKLATCPYCQEVVGKSWQDLIVVDRLRNFFCSCGSQFNLLLGIAKTTESQRQSS